MSTYLFWTTDRSFTEVPSSVEFTLWGRTFHDDVVSCCLQDCTGYPKTLVTAFLIEPAAGMTSKEEHESQLKVSEAGTRWNRSDTHIRPGSAIWKKLISRAYLHARESYHIIYLA